MTAQLAALGAVLAAVAGLDDALRAATAWAAHAPQRRLPRLAPSVLRALQVVAAAAAVGWLVAGVPGLIGGGVLAVLGRRLLGRRGLARARRAAERGSGPLARAVADAVRGGHALQGALEHAAEDAAVPTALRQHLQRLMRSTALGAPLDAALLSLGNAGGSGLRLLAATLSLHRGHGGHLAAELDLLAREAERAQRLAEERQSATAQARATVRTVAALPIIALVGGEAVGGGLLSHMVASPASAALLIVGIGLEVTAVLVARRLVDGIR